MCLQQFKAFVDSRFAETMANMKDIEKNMTATRLNVEEEDAFFDAFETADANDRGLTGYEGKVDRPGLRGRKPTPFEMITTVFCIGFE